MKDQCVNTRLEHFAEEDRCTQADDADLDVKLALDRRFQPLGHPEKVTDDQAEDHREENRLEAQSFNCGDRSHGLRQQSHAENGEQRNGETTQRTAQYPLTDARQNQQEEEHRSGAHPISGGGEVFGHRRHPAGKQQGEQENRCAGPDDHPVFAFKLSNQTFLHKLYINECAKKRFFCRNPLRINTQICGWGSRKRKFPGADSLRETGCRFEKRYGRPRWRAVRGRSAIVTVARETRGSGRRGVRPDRDSSSGPGRWKSRTSRCVFCRERYLCGAVRIWFGSP